MVFNSYNFLIFFPIVMGIYFVIPRKARYVWLLVASYYFYMSWNPVYALLIAISTLVTWGAGLGLEYCNKNGIDKKKLVVAGSLVVNFGILGVFKYFDFFIDTINGIFGVFGLHLLTNPFDLLLPVGISFYTFQAVGYTIDVYRGDIDAERNPLRYALFVSFFPQLVAGPIERSKNLLTQMRRIEEINLWDYNRVANGFMMMLWGYFMKMVIADRAAIIVNNVFNQYWAFGSVEIILASVLFAMQLYGDFGGYTMIAIGAAKVFGFELMENFNTPYLATSVKDHWKRWHISLTSWFKDYVYFPLGGSRCSKLKKYRNVMITFIVSGLWHGASWTYVVWGAINGAYQIVGEETEGFRSKLQSKIGVNTDNFSYKLGRILGTFILIDLSHIVFRADTLKDAFSIIKRIFVNLDPWVMFDGSLYELGLATNEFHILILALILLIAVDLVKYVKGMTFNEFLCKQGLVFRWIVLILLFLAVYVYGIYGPGYGDAAFIYFQF